MPTLSIFGFFFEKSRRKASQIISGNIQTAWGLAKSTSRSEVEKRLECGVLAPL
jgi:hypothetical protein